MQPDTLAASDPLPPRRATPSFMLSHPAHVVALGFGSGLARIAPGTWGTLWAWLSYLVLQRWLSPAQLAALILLSLPVGWWACTVTARNLRSPDPACIVIDEIVCFWIILWLVMPVGWVGQFGAFALFRILDTWKPGPIRWADRRLKGFGWRGGFGILADDLLAAFCTLLLVALWRTF